MKILTAKKGDRHADTSELEKAIDNLVYKLYQLTYDEVKNHRSRIWANRTRIHNN